MTLPAVSYLLIYVCLSLLSTYWLRFVWRVRSTSLIFDSWLSGWSVLLLIGLGYLAGAVVSSDQRLNLALGLISLLAVSLLARRMLGGKQLWSELPVGKNSFLPAVRFFVLYFGLDTLLKQSNHPPLGWDELAVWIPKMQVIAAGRFTEIYDLAIPSYPPFWPVIGSFALQIDSMMLYLLPVFLFIHTVLVLSEYTARRGGAPALVALLFLLPSILNFAVGIQAFSLYANFPVAVLFLAPYLLDKEPEKVRFFFWGIFMLSAVLMRTDTIVPIALLFLFDWKFHGRPHWSLWPVMGYIAWVVVRTIKNIPDEIAGFALQGVTEVFRQEFPVFSKMKEILLFSLKQVWWNRIYWFLPVFFTLLGVEKRWNIWSFWIIAVWGYVVVQYFIVPLGLGADMQWWLGTGWVRMMSLPMFVVFAELALLIGRGVRKVVKLARESA